MADHKAPKGGLFVQGMKVANEGDPVSADFLKALEDQGYGDVMGNSEKTSGGVTRSAKADEAK